MPNRIIKESIFTDERVASLSDFEFRVWVGLMTLADIRGTGDGRPAIIRGRLFALNSDVSRRDVDTAIQKIKAAGLLTISQCDNKPTYTLCDWGSFQPDEGRRTKEYREWRDAVFKRDNYSCQRCGKHGGTLNAHHIIRYRNSESMRTDINNGITLCEKCHRIVHKEEGR